MCNHNDTTTDASDVCCGVGTEETNADHVTSHWLEGDEELDQQLPADLQTALGSFFGTESVETLGAWAEEIRRVTDGTVAVDDLCHADEPTDHWGEVDDQRHHFLCFYDAVVLAAIEERPVDVHTVSPQGETIEARAVGTAELTVTPPDAVFSLGIGHDERAESGGDPTMGNAYAAICPYVRAFPDREAYEQWAESVPAATVATPLAGATAFARALVE